ncbi:DUF4116 domain-containing protein, partial [Roseibium sp. RKSG952]|uniref:DUF4116 domain-containing protein n=1 Tax=Roseibium sp. RKSG952 TaxID=2529384 RepID=UPI0012BBB8C5
IQFMDADDAEVAKDIIACNAGRFLPLLKWAVKQNDRALQYAPENLRMPQMCREAVRQNGRALQFVPETLRTPETCLEAVRQDGAALEHVPEKLRTPE